mgnify:CR=1 FL=1
MKPKFANTESKGTQNRRGTAKGIKEVEKKPLQESDREIEGARLDSTSIHEYMVERMQTKEKEPTRPITLRFEESLWQKVERLRGNLSKNDFFKELVHYYDEHSKRG